MGLWWLAFAVFLYFVCASLLIAEVFVPSGGIITVCSLICLAGGVAIFFRHSVAAGWIGVGIGAMMIPSVLVIAYKLFPRTRFGRSVMLEPPRREQGDAIPDWDALKQMVGAEGVVTSPLRPVGMCDFGGRRVECVAESGYVSRGVKVRVIAVESTQVTVRTVKEG